MIVDVRGFLTLARRTPHPGSLPRWEEGTPGARGRFRVLELGQDTLRVSFVARAELGRGLLELPRDPRLN